MQETALRRFARSTFAGLPRAYWILWFAILVNKIGTFVVPFLYLYLTKSERLSVAHASLIVALYGVGSTCSGPIGGLLADRIGRRATLVLGLVAGACGMAALGFVHAPAALPVLTLAVGFATELHRPAAAAMIADLVAPEHRMRAYGLQHWAVNLGFTFALLLAGTLAQRDYLLLFLGDAATTLVCALIVWRWVRESRPVRVEPAARVLASLWLPLRDRRFATIWLLAMATATIYFQFATTLPEALARHGISPAEYGVLVAATCLVVALVQPIASARLQRANRARALAAACVLIGAGFGSLALFTTLPWFTAAGVVWTLGEIAYVAIVPTIVAALAPAALRGGYQGSYQMAWGVASFAGPACGGLVLQHLGEGWLWGGCFALGISLAIVHYAFARTLDREGR